jgi:hypothetical protein
MQVVPSSRQTVFVLTLHDPCGHGSPGLVAGWHVPQREVADRAQKVVAHWASSPHAAP